MATNAVEYAIKLVRGNAFDFIGSRQLLDIWPKVMFDFLESRIVFEMPEQSDASPEMELAENVVGHPDKIIGNLFLILFSSNFS